MAAKKISLKLLIDTNANKVLFAEASKDFVDFLFFLLSSPIATVVKLLANKSMDGSLGSIYTSSANLKETYLMTKIQKNQVLNPWFSKPFTTFPLLTTGSSTSTSNFYTCKSSLCKAIIITDNNNDATCPRCKQPMDKEMKCETPPTSGGYVKGPVSYMVSDDLSVTPIESLISSIPLIDKFNISNLDGLQEKEVEVGNEEGLELLKISFHSTTVLSDLFLGNKKVKRSIKSASEILG